MQLTGRPLLFLGSSLPGLQYCGVGISSSHCRIRNRNLQYDSSEEQNPRTVAQVRGRTFGVVKEGERRERYSEQLSEQCCQASICQSCENLGGTCGSFKYICDWHASSNLYTQIQYTARFGDRAEPPVTIISRNHDFEDEYFDLIQLDPAVRFGRTFGGYVGLPGGQDAPTVSFITKKL